jgi:hypothetical protein
VADLIGIGLACLAHDVGAQHAADEIFLESGMHERSKQIAMQPYHGAPAEHAACNQMNISTA